MTLVLAPSLLRASWTVVEFTSLSVNLDVALGLTYLSKDCLAYQYSVNVCSLT
jgi:hypothetical protein